MCKISIFPCLMRHWIFHWCIGVMTCLSENGVIKNFLTKEVFSYLLPLSSGAGRVSGISKTSKVLPYPTTGNWLNKRACSSLPVLDVLILFHSFLFRRYPGQTRVHPRVSSEYWFETDLWNCAKSWLLYRRTDRCNGSCWQSVVFNEGCDSYSFLNAPDFKFHHI